MCTENKTEEEERKEKGDFDLFFFVLFYFILEIEGK